MFLIFTVNLFSDDYDITGKWNVYSFSKRWIHTEKKFREVIKNTDSFLPDEQWEFTSENSYHAEGLENTTTHSGSWEITDFNKDYNSSILFINENEFCIITKHSEGSTPFGLLSFVKFVRFHQIRNGDLVDIPVSSFTGLPQPSGDRYYFTNSNEPDIALINTTRDTSLINPPHDNSLIDGSGEIIDNAPSYTISTINTENEKVDPFLDKFYYHLNVYREKYDLVPLTRDTRVEKIAEEYSAVLAKKEIISHNALSDFEFTKLCNNHGLCNVILRENLVAYLDGDTPLEVLSYYQVSPPHNEALLEEKGERLGAGYVKRDGMIFFTAYIVVPK